MDLLPYFEPVSSSLYLNTADHDHAQYFNQSVQAYAQEFPNWELADIVIFGCDDYRGNLSATEALPAADAIRHALYSLPNPDPESKVVDLGNLRLGVRLEDTYAALRMVVHYLLVSQKRVIILGGAQDLAIGLYQAFCDLEEYIYYTSIDALPDILDSNIILSNRSFNHHILSSPQNYIEQIHFIGIQNHYLTEHERFALRKLRFEVNRSTEVKSDLRKAEPPLRISHLVSFDTACIRFSDMPGSHVKSPAGLTIEEACGLMRYAGSGYRSHVLHIAETYPMGDSAIPTCNGLALLVWYFIEATYQRVNDFPAADRSNLKKYRVYLQGTVDHIIFYRSTHTDRWWMVVPSVETVKGKSGQEFLVPCSVADYKQATEGEIPSRWWDVHYRTAM
jgi:arginase family enzyme